MNPLVNNLIRHGYLKNDLLIDAFSEISRVEFVPKDLECEAEKSFALPVGSGRTVIQPRMAAVMLDLLDPRRGNTILELGSGSGWITGLLAYVVGKSGHIIAIETVAGLNKFGRDNIEKFGYISRGTVSMMEKIPKISPAETGKYDRIISTIAYDQIPAELKDRLAVGGNMVLVIGSTVIFVQKRGEKDFYQETFPGFSVWC